MAKKKKRETLLRRLARLMKMAALGRHYKSDLQRRLEQRQLKTVRTKAVTKAIRDAGLTEAEIRRLRGK